LEFPDRENIRHIYRFQVKNVPMGKFIDHLDADD